MRRERKRTMSNINSELIKATAFSQPYTSALGKKEPLAHPKNCKTECPYGYGRAYCFPCFAKIMAGHRTTKEVTMQGA